jgi:hypothetical protein
MSYGDMRRWASQHHVLVGSDFLQQGRQGIYDAEYGTILIDRGMNYTQKRCTFVHEWVHSMYGDIGCGRLAAKSERRTSLKTAQLLIDPLEYATAEEMFDGDLYRMAAELNVTHQVIKDYQLWLDSHPSACRRSA